MSRKLSDIKLTDKHRGVETGRFFLVPAKMWGKECTKLYKVFGFEADVVYAQRIHKRSGKMPGNAPIFECFDFDIIFPKG